MLLVLDSDLTPLFNRTLSNLVPPFTSRYPQVVVDSDDFIYVTGDAPEAGAVSVWVMENKQGTQMDQWAVKFSTYNFLLAIDVMDSLYFQDLYGDRKTYLFTTGGDVVDTYDLFKSRDFDFNEHFTDFTVDALLTMYFVENASPQVWRYDINGKELPPFTVLSGDFNLRNEQGQVACDRNGVLYVYDNIDNVIEVIGDDGSIRRTLSSKAASLRWGDELIQDPKTGELLYNEIGRHQLTRISQRDGSLVQTYEAKDRCVTGGVDVGGRTGFLYAHYTCLRDNWGFFVRSVEASGRLQSQVQVPFFGYKMRVDEWNDRIYLLEGAGERYIVHTLNLRGDFLFDIDPTPSFNRIDDIVLVRGELAVLDNYNRRIVWCNRAGNITDITPIADDLKVSDMAWDEGAGDLYIALTQNGDRSNSSIVRLERDGSISARFVTWGSQWDGAIFHALDVGDWGLFAYDFNYQSIVVWRDHRRVDTVSSPVVAERRSIKKAGTREAVWMNA